MKEHDVSDPFIFLTTHTVKDGRLEDLERLGDEFLEFVEANEPRLLAIGGYLNGDRDRFTLVQVHPDAKSMDDYLQVAGEKIHQGSSAHEEAINQRNLDAVDELAVGEIESHHAPRFGAPA